MVEDDITYHPTLFVVFGIPGAGKTTIAKHVVQKLLTSANNFDCDTSSESGISTIAAAHSKQQHQYSVLDLDLDDCVPEWMRLNFTKGIYPSLQQRHEFAISCCDYVNESLRKFKETKTTSTASMINTTSCSANGTQILRIIIIVSFSFVNEDLRIHFRQEFPNSYCILIHTNEIEAQRRIQQRSNHFYKGKHPLCSSSEGDEGVVKSSSSDNSNNDEWNFAPVTFPHTIINGHNPIEQTSSDIVALIHTAIQT